MAFQNIIFSAGGGFLFGAVSRYSIRKLMKLAAIIVGLFVVVLAYLSYNGWLDVEWIPIEDIYNGHNYYRPFCPTNDAWTQSHGVHSSIFCAGFVDEYNAQWTSLSPYFMQQHWNRVNNQQIDQNSNVNIKGNNNRITVNQNVNNNVGHESNGYDGSGTSSGYIAAINQVVLSFAP